MFVNAEPYEVWYSEYEWAIVEVDRSGLTDKIAYVDHYKDPDEAYSICDEMNAEEQGIEYENYLCIVEERNRDEQQVGLWVEVWPGRSAKEAAVDLGLNIYSDNPTAYGFGDYVVEVIAAVPVWRWSLAKVAWAAYSNALYSPLTDDTIREIIERYIKEVAP